MCPLSRSPTTFHDASGLYLPGRARPIAMHVCHHLDRETTRPEGKQPASDARQGRAHISEALGAQEAAPAIPSSICVGSSLDRPPVVARRDDDGIDAIHHPLPSGTLQHHARTRPAPNAKRRAFCAYSFLRALSAGAVAACSSVQQLGVQALARGEALQGAGGWVGGALRAACSAGGWTIARL